MRISLALCQLLCSVHIANAGFRVLGHWFLDGSDTDISVHNGPTYTVSSDDTRTYRAIKFTAADKSYAMTRAINLTDRNFTIACWIKLAGKDERRKAIYSNWYSPWNFIFAVNGDLLYFLYHKETNDQKWKNVKIVGGKVHAERWTHVAVTVDRFLRKGVLYVDATETAYKRYGENERFYGPTKDTFDIGRTDHPDQYFFGEMMDLYVLDQALSPKELRRLKDMKMKSQMFHSMDVGFAFSSHVFQTETNVTECAQCMFLCHLHEECVSFNFNQRDQICELSDAGKDADPANHKARAGFMYYEQSSSQLFTILDSN